MLRTPLDAAAVTLKRYVVTLKPARAYDDGPDAYATRGSKIDKRKKKYKKNTLHLATRTTAARDPSAFASAPASRATRIIDLNRAPDAGRKERRTQCRRRRFETETSYCHLLINNYCNICTLRSVPAL